MKKWLIFFVLFLCCLNSYSQLKYKISGYVKDSATKETLIGATLQVIETGRLLTTNQYGYFSITLNEGEYSIYAFSIGYTSLLKKVNIRNNIEIDILLSPNLILSNEIVISATKKDGNILNAQMGQIDLSMSKIKSLPVLFGEIDPLKTLQLFPGISNAGEGNSGIFVRGGGADQNLLLLDDAVVYNSGHLFGFFSILKNSLLLVCSLSTNS